MNGSTGIKKSGGTGDEWLTPLKLWGQIRTKFFSGIDGILDPCPYRARILPGTRVTEDPTDGLEIPWVGPTFVNPPFSDITPWIQKARSPIGAEVVMLLPVRADSDWWHTHARYARIVFIRKRVNYEDPRGGKSACSFASCLLIFGNGHRVDFWEPQAQQELALKEGGRE